MTDLKDVPTCELFEELKKREGVTAIDCPDPSWEYYIAIEPINPEPGELFEGPMYDTGPATILVVID